MTPCDMVDRLVFLAARPVRMEKRTDAALD
jgi:hypothetical protein